MPIVATRVKKSSCSFSDLPATVSDEAILIPRSETRYWLLLGDEEVELLARGIVSETTAQRAFSMLSWKRDQQRASVEALEETYARTGEPELTRASQLPRQPTR
jgi:hypothetical protein